MSLSANNHRADLVVHSHGMIELYCVEIDSGIESIEVSVTASGTTTQGRH